MLVDGQAVGTDAEYAQSAAELANVDPAELKAVASGDWLPLGTFSWAIADSEVDPARVIHLMRREQRGAAVQGAVECPGLRLRDRVEQALPRPLELPLCLRRAHAPAQPIADLVESVVLRLGELPRRLVSGGYALHLHRPQVVPQRDVREVILDRPAVERWLAHLLVAEAVDRGHQSLASAPKVPQ